MIKAEQTISIEKIKSESGGVSVGIAQDGSEFKVYNLNVTQEVIERVLKEIQLDSKQAKEMTFELFDFIEKLYRNLPLKGMGKTSELILNFSLIDLFIPLNARLTVPKSDTLEESFRLAGRELSDEEAEHIGGAMDAAQPIISLIGQYPVLVILGDPGSGKSTVVRFLTYLLVTGQGDGLGLNGYLPLLIPLANYSEKLEQNPNLMLREFAFSYYQNLVDIEGLNTLIEAKLNSGKVLIMLDGLDEVRVVQQRSIVVDRVQRFLCKYIGKGNRAVMTSRIIGYQEVRPPEVEGLRECTLLDFDDDEIECFITRWTHVIEKHAHDAGHVAHYEATRESKELIAAVRSNKSVRKLAANPLLLTMLVKEKRQGVTLPRHRVVLYERYIVSLMEDWLVARTQYDTQRELPNARILRKTLEPLAWWLQETEPGKGLVNEANLLKWLGDFYKNTADPEESARKFIYEVREYSGLLLDRGGRKYGFLHLTFMEYLAGVHLANQFQQVNGFQKIVSTIIQYADKADWKEVLLLAIGHLGLNQCFDQLTTEILQKLLEQEKQGESNNAVIVASALADIGEEGITLGGWQQLRQQLLQQYVLNSDQLAKQRTHIGRLLAEVKDPRSYVTDINAMQFCYIPKAAFFMGSTDTDTDTDTDKDAFEREIEGAGEYQIKHDYWMARFPITVAQFKQFIEQADFKPENENCVQDADNTPVVRISWYEAMSFCKWLTKRWHDNGYLSKALQVSLPSETEWEMAAKGGSKIPKKATDGLYVISDVQKFKQTIATKVNTVTSERYYPWGEKPDSEKMNYQRDIGSVSSVGCYPAGASPYGCEEMSGNVWEWTRSSFNTYPYPAEINKSEWQAIESADSTLSRVLRGGAFGGDQGSVRCAYRNHDDPGNRGSNIGFRIVLSPLL